MADNVVSLEGVGAGNAGQRVEGFVMRNRLVILSAAAVLVLAAVAACVVVGVTEAQHKNGIARVDAIEYAYTRDAGELAAEEVAARQNTALEALRPFMGRRNVVGVRANMLAADISFARKEYAAGAEYYVAAAEAGRKAYTAPLCYYNAAVCYEELGQLEDAAAYYGRAVERNDFVRITHALFNLGRVKESADDYAGAAAAYQRLVDEYSGDSWTDLAQSRLIALRLEGRI